MKTKATATDSMQRKGVRFSVKSTDGRSFTGLASTWDVDYGGDLILPGAYKRTLEEWKTSGRVIKLIDQHNYDSVLDAVGKMRDAEETADGLLATFELLGGAEGEPYQQRLKDGVVDSLSIGYQTRAWREPTEEEKLRGVQRVLTDIELREVSLVLFPMNPYALIDTSSVKSIAASLASLKREDLTDDDKKTVRQIAALSGALLRPVPPATGDEPPADGETDEAKQRHPPEASPESTADAPKAYPDQDALQQRLRALRVKRTITRITTGGVHV